MNNQKKNQPFTSIHHHQNISSNAIPIEAPIRDGLGAGGQRPSEKRGFFDYATRSWDRSSPEHGEAMGDDISDDCEIQRVFYIAFGYIQRYTKIYTHMYICM